MGEAKRRKLVGETEEQIQIRQQQWEKDKLFSKQFKKAHRHIKGRFDPDTKEITEY